MPAHDITLDPARIDAVAAHAFLTRTYWSPGIPLDVVRRAIEHSLCAAVFEQGRQVAFARAVTDRATFAYLADVYVLEDHRGRGLARQMVAALLAHPDLQGLRRILLVTRDAHGLYEKFGFVPVQRPASLMELHQPDVYAQGHGRGA